MEGIPMKTINWHTEADDTRMIFAITRRIKNEIATPDDTQTVMMDLTACHANGCPLRLNEMLTADKFDLAHDYYGIRNNLNRSTGQLEGCFFPRFGLVEVAA